MSSYSVCSNYDLSLTCTAIFPKLKTTFNIARTKSIDVINHGLAPCFKSLLKTSTGRFDVFLFSFDESLKEATQTSEMDLYIRFWDVNENKVNVR